MCAAGLRIFQSRLFCFPIAVFQKKLYNKYNSSPAQKRAYGMLFTPFRLCIWRTGSMSEKNFETGGTNHTEQTSKLIYGNDPTAATAVLSMAFVIVIYRIESISINSEKEEKI